MRILRFLTCSAIILLAPMALHAESDREASPTLVGDFYSRIWDPAFRDMMGRSAQADIKLAEGPFPEGSFHAAWLEALGSNIRISNPAGDGPSEVQAETAVAAFGPRVIAGWNDSKGFTSGTISSYAYSTDGGLSWTDGGDLPTQGLGPGEQIYGDPGLAADRHGHWFYSSLYFMPGGVSAIGVNRATFTGAAPVWQPPVAIAPSPTDFQDKCAIGCDPDSPYVYVIWTRFFNGQGDAQMEFVRSSDGGASFGPSQIIKPLTLGNPVESGYIVVDEQGGVNLFWEDALDLPIGTGIHPHMLHRRSTDHGATFSPIDTAATIHPNWYTGPPGFNRRDGFFEFASAACDLSAGPRRGTIYLTWNDACEPIFSGVPGSPQLESEPNNTLALANPIPVPIRVSGSVTPAGDVDMYKFSGTAGQMVRVTVTPHDTLYPWVRLSNATAIDTLLFDSRVGPGSPANGWVTLPSSGTYVLQVQARDNSTSGAYLMDLENVTAGPGSAARDHRDIVCVTSSDHGAHWSAPVLVNDDPPLFDNCMSDVSVDSLGYAHIFWYDRRNDPVRGGRADIYYARSSNGGQSWSSNLRVTDGATTWQVPARIQPNFGDYSTSVSTGNTTLPIFADARFGTPDAFTQVVQSGFTLGAPADTSLSHGDTLAFVFPVGNLAPFAEEFVYDIQDSSGLLGAVHDSVALAPQGSALVIYRKLVPDSLHASYADPVTLTGRYRSSAFASRAARAVASLHGGVVAVGGGPRFETRLGLPSPNPSRGAVRLDYSLSERGSVEIGLYDVSGRRVAQLAGGVRPAGAYHLDWKAGLGEVPSSGVFFVRASLGGAVLIRRMVLLK